MIEGLTFDKKSIKSVSGKNSNFYELAKDCVAFANAKGGDIYIGIEDGDNLPPSGQIIEDKLLQQIPVRISQLTVNTSVFAQKCVAENGAEYIDLKVQPSNSTIAGTTDGRFYIRIGDQSTILHPDQLLRLLTDKPSYSWELKTTRTSRNNYDPNKFAQFVLDVRSSSICQG